MRGLGQPARARAAAAAAAVALLCCAGGVRCAAALPYALDRLFTQENSALWTGADCASSFTVPSSVTGSVSRTVFLFGDTLVGQVVQGAGGPQRASNSTMVHSSVGVVEWTTGSAPNVTYSVKYNASSGQYDSLFQPNDAERAEGYYWWVVQGITAVSGPQAVLLAVRIKPASGGFGFAVNGTALLYSYSIASTDATQWKVAYYNLPFSDGNLTWTTSLFRTRDGGDGFVYVMGALSPDGTGGRTVPVLARVLDGALFPSFSAARGGAARPPWSSAAIKFDFLVTAADGSAQWASWSSSDSSLDSLKSKLYPLWDGESAPESTVAWSQPAASYLWPVIQTWGTFVLLRAAQAPQQAGNWSSLLGPVFAIPPPLNNSTLYFSYAAKLHPELRCSQLGGSAADADGVVATFNTNAWHGDQLFTPAGFDAYVPFFFCLPDAYVAELLNPPAPAVASAPRAAAPVA